jgi:DNA ligase-associated metallophosphoesterase
LNGQTLLLGADRSLFWEEAKTLFVADMHLGKDVTFRRSGIPMPGGATQGTLTRLQSAIHRTGCEIVYVLGDLIHARSSLDEETCTAIRDFLVRNESTQFQLVEGNHDRGSRQLLNALSLDPIAPGIMIAPFCLVHDESTERPSDLADSTLLAGHIHPAVVIGRETSERLRLPCFWLSNQCMTLPAFGEFTGAKCVQPRRGDQVFAIADNEIFTFADFR